MGWLTTGKSAKFKQKERQEQQIEGLGTVVEVSDP
jgi:hypothetical protein